MAEVTFKINLLVNGEKKVVSATTDVSQLADEFEKAKTRSTQLRDDLLKYSQIGASLQNVVTGLQQITGVIRELTSANSEEVVAGAKLANNMRNTMAATDAQVQSIKELCAAQQQLGVIGDEVQLAGAQELATYLTKKQSLEQLIPVMNDMLAQQYGLTASSEQAAQIASMLGKVMDGQVGALSRYGYKFDEAQEKILKFGTEEQRAAVLTDVVTSAVGGMNAALAQTDAGKAKQLANEMGDWKEKIGALFAEIEPLIVAVGELGLALMSIGTTLSGIRGAYTGLAALAAAAKSSAIATYAQAAAVRASTIVTYAQAAAGKVASVAQVLWNTQLRLGTQAQLAWTFSAKAAAIQAGVLRVALLGLMGIAGVGLVIAAIYTAVSIFSDNADEASRSADRLARAQKSLEDAHNSGGEAAERARLQIESETDKLADLISSHQDTTEAVQALNSKYSEAFGYHETAVEWYNVLIAKSDEYCEQLYRQAVAQNIADRRAQNAAALRENYNKQERLRGQIDEIGGGFFNFKGASLGRELRKAQEEAATLRIESELLKEEWEEFKPDFKLGKSIELPTPPGDGDKKNGKTGKEPLKLIEQPKSLEDLKNNVQYYEQAVSKADKTDREHLKTLVGKLDAAKQLVAAFEQDMEGMSLQLRLEGWQEIDKELRAKGISLEGKEAQPIGVPVVLKPEKQLTEWMPIAKPADTTTPDYKRSRYDFLSQQAQRVQQDFEIGIIGENEALSKIEDINAALRGLGLNEIEIPLQTENVDKAKKKFEGATDAVGQMGQSLAGLGSALELPELNIAGTIAQAIATMAQGYAQASAQASALGPWGWIAFAATGLAQLTAMIASVKQATAFAQGGIVSGPTMALVGEYAGASNNPEVIAPLDKLRSMIGPQEGISGRVVFKIEGRTLRGVLEREHHHLARS